MRKTTIWVLALVGLMGFYCARSERARLALMRITTVEDFAAHGKELVWPPWHALMTYTSIDDDTRLFFAFANVIVGERADEQTLRQWSALDEKTPLPPALFSDKRWRIPYVDVPLGFPPLALIMMTLPRAVAATLPAYRIAFAILAALLYLAAWSLAGRFAQSARLSTSGMMRRAFLATVCFGPLFVQRFDVLPAFFVAAALVGLALERPAWASVLMLVAASAKLYPAMVLLPWLGLAWGFSTRKDFFRLSAPLAVAAVLGVAVVVVSGDLSLFSVVKDYFNRPLQIESIGGSLMLASGSAVAFRSGSDTIAAPLASGVGTFCDLAMVTFCVTWSGLALRWAKRYGTQLDRAGQLRAFARFTLAGVCGVLITSKVLSPQYLIWLFPLAPLLTRGRLFGLFCALLFATHIYFPFMYQLLVLGMKPLVGVLLVRNLLLVVFAVLTLRAALLPPAASESVDHDGLHP